MSDVLPEAILKQVPEIIPVLTDPTNLWVNISFAIITLLAVIVALFQERIRKFWNKAKLDMKIKLKPPDCHQIALSNSNTGQFVGNSIYIRILVNHIKVSAGENVEIMPTCFWKLNDNKKEVLKHFLPISLVWSHFQPRQNTTRIPVGLFRHCDFGHFIKNPNNNQAVLILDTMIQPNPVANNEVPNIIKPGKYCFELLLSGDNVKSVRKKWILDFNTWSDDESKMLTDNIKIREA